MRSCVAEFSEQVRLAQGKIGRCVRHIRVPKCCIPACCMQLTEWHTTALSNTVPVRSGIVLLEALDAAVCVLNTIRGCRCIRPWGIMASVDSQHALFLYRSVLQKHAISCTHAFRPRDSERR